MLPAATADQGQPACEVASPCARDHSRDEESEVSCPAESRRQRGLAAPLILQGWQSWEKARDWAYYEQRRLFRCGLCVCCSVSPDCLFAQGDAPPKAPADVKPGSIGYEDVAYPYPVSYLPLVMYGQDVRMAYMDVPPLGQPNGRTVVLFHGMNFGGFYFAGPIEALRKEGFRVVAPDQIGFGRSSKAIIPYNFHDMALNSRRLLESLGIAKVSIVGHSMGGMLAARFAASFPDITERAVIYDPIGLTDIRYERPWRSADEAYKATMAQTNDQRWQGFYANIRRYFPAPGAWKPEYEKYVRILYAPTLPETGRGWRWCGRFTSRCCISTRWCTTGRRSR